MRNIGGKVHTPKRPIAGSYPILPALTTRRKIPTPAIHPLHTPQWTPSAPYARRSRRLLPSTNTLDRPMAAAPSTGESNRPVNG